MGKIFEFMASGGRAKINLNWRKCYFFLWFVPWNFSIFCGKKFSMIFLSWRGREAMLMLWLCILSSWALYIVSDQELIKCFTSVSANQWHTEGFELSYNELFEIWNIMCQNLKMNQDSLSFWNPQDLWHHPSYIIILLQNQVVRIKRVCE